MDLPAILEDMEFVSSSNEIKQVIKLLLLNQKGTFFQSYKIGSLIGIHSSDVDEIEEGIRQTLAQIPDLVVQKVSMITFDNFEVTINYKGNVEQFTFNIDV